MPATPDIEMLLASLAVEQKNLEKQLAKATGVFDKQTLRMERRAAQMTKQVNAQFAKVAQRASFGAAAYGIGRMVSSVSAWGGQMQDISEQTKVSTDFLQEYGIMAQRSGSNQEAVNNAVANFAKNVGLAQMGMPKVKKMFDVLGVNPFGSVEEVFYRVADAIAAAGTQEQKNAIVTKLFGDEARNLTSTISQGSKALREQEEQLKKNGLVLDKDGIQKLDELGDTWEEVQRQLTVQLASPITVGFMDSIKDFSGEIGSEQFKSNLKEFGERLGDVAKWVMKIAPYLPQIAAVWGVSKIGGKKAGVAAGLAVAGVDVIESGVRWGLDKSGAGAAFNAAAVRSERGRLTQELNQLRMVRENMGAIPGYDAAIGPFSNSESQRKKRLAEAELRIPEIEERLRQLSEPAPKPAPGAPVPTARPNITKTRNYQFETGETGSSRRVSDMRRIMALEMKAYDDSQRKLEDVAYAAFAARAADKEKIDEYIGSIDEEIAALRISASTMGMTAAEADRYRLVLQAGAVAAELEKNGNISAAEAIRSKMADYVAASEGVEGLVDAERRAIDTADTLRSGLSQLGSLRSFENLGDAVAKFCEQLAEAVWQINVMEPAIEALTGKRGTPIRGSTGGKSGSGGSGAGLVGDAFQGAMDIMGYEGGAKSAPGGIALVGESGPELVNIPRGAEVIPNGPSMAMLKGGRGSMNYTNFGGNILVNGDTEPRSLRVMKAMLDQQVSEFDNRWRAAWLKYNRTN